MNANISWIFLFIAGAFEVAWVVALKYSHGFTRLVPSISMVVALFFSMLFLSLAARNLPLGMSYAVWTGIGTVGGMLAGRFLFAEAANPMQIFFAALIVVGIAGVKFAAD